MPPDFETFALTRLDQMEARQRRLTRFGLILLLGNVALALLLLFQLARSEGWLGAPGTVTATRFVLLDEAGRMRGEWREDEGPRLTLSTSDGLERATLWVNHNGAASLILLDNKSAAGH